MKNANLLQLFIYCLLKANHKSNEFIFGGSLVKVERGSFIAGRFEIAKALNMNPSSVYKNLKKLQLLSYISLNSNNKNTMITVIKYDSYQTAVTTKEQQSNNKVTTKEQQSNTNKNDKNIKNDKNEDSGLPPARKDENSNAKNSFLNNYNIIPPKIEDVRQRFIELKYVDQSEKFYHYYNANGWKVGKNKMVNWSSAIVNWNKNNFISNGHAEPELKPGFIPARDNK